MLPLHFSHLYKFSHVPKSGVRAISLLPSSLYYATSYKTKHCLLGRNTPTTQLLLSDLSFHTPHRDAQSLYVQGLVLSFGFCICGYSNNSCTLGSVFCFTYGDRGCIKSKIRTSVKRQRAMSQIIYLFVWWRTKSWDSTSTEQLIPEIAECFFYLTIWDT